MKRLTMMLLSLLLTIFGSYILAYSFYVNTEWYISLGTTVLGFALLDSSKILNNLIESL